MESRSETIANPRTHATTGRVITEAFAEERPHLKTLPLAPYRTVLKLERRITRDGMVSVGGNLYSVPDSTRRRTVEVQCLAEEVLILQDGQVVASHPVLEGHNRRRVAPDSEAILAKRPGDRVAQRPLEVYETIACELARQGARP